MLCSCCRDEAITFQEYSGKHLCRRHFCGDIEAKAKHSIRMHQWLRPGDHIGVVMSDGGKSRALLFFLHTLIFRRRDISISAIVIDEGDNGKGRTDQACQYAETLGVPVIRAMFKDFSRLRMEEISGSPEPVSSIPHAMLWSILCEAVAREQGITKFATAHSLDDEALAVLESVMSGKPEEILLCSLDLPRKSLPVIHPFIAISDDDIGLYMNLHLLECDSPALASSRTRPGGGKGFAASLMTSMNDYTHRHPATKYSLMHLGENIRGAGIECRKILNTCERCGDPFSTTCARCWISQEVMGNGT